MKLSQNFSLDELTKSQTAERLEIDNNPAPDCVQNLKFLAKNILQPVRDHFGVAFSPSSGFRSPDLCVAIGSNPTSQHAQGKAVDFEVPGVSNLELAEWIRDNLEFDQLILEYYKPGKPSSGWVHCSTHAAFLRKEVLTFDGKRYHRGLNV